MVIPELIAKNIKISKYVENLITNKKYNTYFEYTMKYLITRLKFSSNFSSIENISWKKKIPNYKSMSRANNFPLWSYEYLSCLI